MIEALNQSVLWWHWIILGFVLLIVEMNTGTFLLLGLGMSAILVGIIDNIFVTSFTQELSIWIILSLINIWIWFKWFKPTHISNSGQSNYRLDTLGVVIEDIKPNQRGKVRFDRPVLGNSSWHSTSNEEILKDTKVEIVSINGQLIEVKKYTKD